MSNFAKTARRTKIRQRVRSKISGTAEKPRISVFKSSKHLYAQVIDDQAQTTLVSASSLSKDIQGDLKGKAKQEQAEIIGEYLGKKAVEQGVKKVIFDRSGYRYHGVVKNLAEGARKGGLQF
ncbi:MAG: 50S ribosomal protein L18 [Balneolales bacterium]